MRPIRLTMQAFGSYKEKTTIDFRKPDQNLFLITGDTGAGKTTIFDAIVFALYGEASSLTNVKSGKELQSQFAGPDTEPYINLLFSEKNGEDTAIYTVMRVPAHSRNKKRGTGTIDVSEKVSLWTPEGKEFSGNQKETNRKLEEIVGLNKAQFMQIAMIAQGEFMELLRAKSNDKKEIFRKLFHTDLYDRIVRELDARKKSKLNEIETIETVCRTEAGHLVIPEEDAQAESLLSLQQTLLSSEKTTIPSLEKFEKELPLLRERLRKQQEKAVKACEQAASCRDRKRDAYTNAKNLQKTFDQLDASQKELQTCADAREEMEEARRLTDSIDTAYELKALRDRFEEAAAALERSRQDLAYQTQNLPRFEQQVQEALTAEEEKRQKQTDVFREFTRIEARVNQAFDILQDIRTVRESRNKKELDYVRLQEAEENALKSYTAFTAQVQLWRTRAEEWKDADLQLEKCRQKRAEADAITADITALQNAQLEIDTQLQTLQTETESYEKARASYHRIDDAYQEKLDAFLDAQAGYLAREKLKPGQPCPVCGSLSHPSPCTLSEEHQELTREAIEQLETRLTHVRRELETASRKAHAAQELYKEKEGTYTANLGKLNIRIRKFLPDAPPDESPEDAAHLMRSKREELDHQQRTLQKNADQLQECNQNLKDADAKENELKSAWNVALQEKNDAHALLEADRIKLKELEKQTAYETEDEAKAALQKADTEKKQADEKFHAAREEVQNARAVRDRAKTLIEQFRGELPAKEEEASARQEAYQAALAREKTTESEWQAMVRQYTREQPAAFREKIADYRQTEAAARRSYQDAKALVGNEKRPQLEALEDEALQAETQAQEMQAACETLKRSLCNVEEVSGKLTEAIRERRKLVMEYDRIERLYQKLAGKVSAERMDLETYVQRTYLRQILHAANLRFREMSAGQYELRIIEEEQAKIGGNHGLDLTVYSTVTGREREIRTLSGGESFMAALSLALGMADQIRMNSAAINLDILFIDEGFGSLDDQSRNQAVKVLQQMAGGDKLIGIISHVTELKQQIDDQLLVTKDEKGSHARWQIR